LSTVSLIRCEQYGRKEVEEAVHRAVNLMGGPAQFFKSGDQVLLKPNMLSANVPEKHITTHPEVVRAAACLVMDAGAKPCIGDSPALEPFSRVAAKSGMSAIARELGIPLVELTNPTLVTSSHDSEFKKLEISRQVLDADAVINLPKLKTHCQMLLTLGIKNLFGTVVGQQKGEWHFMAGVDRDTFASLHLDIYQAVKPALTILDGVWGMEGHGPSNGSGRQLSLIAASADTVALDITVCHLLGIPLESFPIYRVARTRAIGETSISRITLAGDPSHIFAPDNFRVPQLDSLSFVPGFFTRLSKRFFVSRPVCRSSVCTGCGQCASICPAEAIAISDEHSTFDYDRCIRCFCCQEICPENAITFHRGLLVRMAGWLKALTREPPSKH